MNRHFTDSGWAELKEAFVRHDLWFWFGLLDIRLRYRRVVLGPWWVTLSLASTVGLLGLLYAHIFQVAFAVYLPYFAAGMVLWTFISAQLTEAAGGFIQFEHTLRQVRIPLPTCLLRILWRNLLVFAHNSVIVLVAVGLAAWLETGPDSTGGTGTTASTTGHIALDNIAIALLALPGLALLGGTLFGLSLITAILCTRYRDLVQVVTVLLQLLFFLTPILWKAEALGRHAWVVQANPVFHLIEMVRTPLLGGTPALLSTVTSLSLCVLVNLAAIRLFSRHHRRIVYWL